MATPILPPDASPVPIVVVDYDAGWPARYEEERHRVREAFGDRLVDLQHVGSTAVPDLAAKPIIDIMAVLLSFPPSDADCADLLAIGYLFLGEQGVPGRAFFAKPNLKPRAFNLGVYPVGHPSIERLILLRDFLRADPEEARRYGDRKRVLAESHRSGNLVYSDAKRPYMDELIGRARARRQVGKP